MASYNNRSLFSDYYLEERVGGDPHWQALKNKTWEYRQRISNILEKALPGINGDTPEAEVERRLIRPILDALGHTYFVQPPVPSPEGTRRPDYAFFPSSEARQEAESHKGQIEFFKTVLAVGDAKAWERSLDKRAKGPGDPFTNHNPSYQIDFYLRATDKRWGLLTNGRCWRLYHRDLSYRLDVYYEVDLAQIITLDEDTFLYFLAFFHKDAFQPDGTGECFLDRAYRASTEYATKVSEELKGNVYEALRLLAEGLFSFPGNALKPEDLDLVRENAFIVIYRLLFVLYAEAREFLPVSNPTYWSTYSLRALTHEIATKEPFEANLHPTATGYWSRLQELFRLINNGDDFLGIPPYNGRLFDDQKEHQSLAAWQIGDRYLAEAIDQLARAWAAGRTGRGFVSYRDLSIRELGSIYEGLLEHRPRYAIQDMAVVKENKREKFVPLAEIGSGKALKVYAAGSVYLETDKGERKATGSYYTPDYIVKYIISNTLGTLLEEAKKSDSDLIDAILTLKVLDPAMGSGHFLVEATDYLARALVEALGGDPREMEEDDVRWARREVVERCIYGVDLNPLAVDLAKLSLWLSTVSLDKPLNFLDHHLRCGNSLIGARLEDIGLLPEISKKSKATAVTTLAGYQFKSAVASAVSTFHKIAEAPSDSVEDIHRKEGAYETARYALSRIKSIADVWTSVYFGNEVKDKDAYERVLSLAEQDGTEWPTPGELTWLDKAKSIDEERHFFHWELEFPEVFFDREGQILPNAGFDAVVGNPPYNAELEPSERDLFSLNFTLSWGNYNTANLFMEAAALKLTKGGDWGLIVPKSLNYSSKWATTREFILSHIDVLGDASKAFEDVLLEQVVVISHKSVNEEFVRTCVFTRGAILSETQVQREVLKRLKVLVSGLEPEEMAVGVKVFNSCSIMSKVASISRGALLQRETTSSGDIPVYRGDSIGRYEIHEARDFISKATFDHRKRQLEYVTCPKIMVQNIIAHIMKPPDHIIFMGAYDELGRINLDNVGNIYLDDKRYSPYYVVGVLNSVLTSWYLYRFVYAKAIRTMRYDGYHLERTPIPYINFTTPKAERDRMVEQSKNLCEEYLQSKNWDEILSFIAQHLPLKPDGTPDEEHEQSDVVHDLLAFLAEEMTRFHKEKQTEIRGFLGWLESYSGISVEDLRNKTKVKEYWKAEVGWEGFLDALVQNRRAIQAAKGIDVTRREPQEKIRPEFDASLAKLKPLLGYIELTDRLIDQIVYKLYGLTPDEIAVVEGSSGK